MTLADLLEPDRVVADLRVADKPGLLDALAHLAARHLPVQVAAVAAALGARERLGSTGLGRGFALPHARVEGVARLTGLFARLARPIDFEAIDGAPVDLVFLLLIPPGGGSHVAALAAITRTLREDATATALRQARSAPLLFRQLVRQEEK